LASDDRELFVDFDEKEAEYMRNRPARHRRQLDEPEANPPEPAQPPPDPKRFKKRIAVVVIVMLLLAVGGGMTLLAILSRDILDDFAVFAGHVSDYYNAVTGNRPEVTVQNSDELEPYYGLDEYEHEYDPILMDRRTQWEELGLTPDTYELDEFFAAIGHNVSVFYKNLDTGFTYLHNPDRVFFAASLSKSNHALYVYALAELGLVDMNEVHFYTSGDRWGGTGVLRFEPFDSTFTTRELLGLSIQESDNAAYRMLIRMTTHTQPSYRDFVAEIGGNVRMIQNVISQNTNAHDAGLWMYSIFNYIESDSLYGHYLKYDLMNTAQTSHHYFDRWEGSYGRGGTVNVSMIQSDYPLARKYGWARNAFHDAAIVYATSPYILVILSNMDRGAHDLFEEISWVMQDFNYEWFASQFND